MATPEETPNTVPRMKGSRNRSSQAENPYGELPPEDAGGGAPPDPPERPVAGSVAPPGSAPPPVAEPAVVAPSAANDAVGSNDPPSSAETVADYANPYSGVRRGQNDDGVGAFDPVDLENNRIDSDLMAFSREVVNTIEERAKTRTPLTTAEISQARETLRLASRNGVFSVGGEDSSEKRRFRIWNEIVNGTVPNADRVDGQPGDNSFLFTPAQWYETAQDANPETSAPRWETLKSAIEHQLGVLYAEWKLVDVMSTDVGKSVAAKNYDSRRKQVSLAIANDFSNLLNAHAETGAKDDGHYSQKAIYDMMSLDLGQQFAGEGVTGTQAGNMDSVRLRGIRKGMRLAQEQADIRNLGTLDDPFAEYAERQAAERSKGQEAVHGLASDAPATHQGADAAPKGTVMSSDNPTTSPPPADQAAPPPPAAPSGLPPRSVAASTRPEAAIPHPPSSHPHRRRPNIQQG